MENQYTYYKPEPDDMNGMNEETPKPKKNRKVPKPVKLVCAGVAFGLVASATFLSGMLHLPQDQMRRSCIWSCGKCNIPDRKLCGNKSVRHNNYKR